MVDSTIREETGLCTLDELFLHPRLVLPEFPAVVASPESAARIRHGGAVNLPEFSKSALVRVFAGQRELLAIARRVAGTLFQPNCTSGLTAADTKIIGVSC